MSAPIMNVRWVLARRPGDQASLEDFRREEVLVGELGDGEILVRNVYISLDPYHRQLMDDHADRFGVAGELLSTVIEPVALGETMHGAGVGVVEASQDARFSVGDVVEGYLGYQTYCVALGTGDGSPALAPLSTEATAAGGRTVVQKFDPTVAPIYTRLNALGEQGLTAHVGLLEVGRPRPGETVFVSSAAGSCGQVAGQVARIMGCRVVGSAGSEEKLRFCVDELGFDAALNYKDPDFEAQLDAACPDGIDVYLDLVGGAQSDIVFSRLNMYGRHAVVGTIADWWADSAKPEHRGPRVYWSVNLKRIRMEGFVLWDYDHLYEPYMRQLQRWWQQGKLRSREHIVEGIDAAPQGLLDLFEGKNFGKALCRVSEDPYR
ncbi:MAG TPA: NADP-dependent oxidoreductase [Baekduia sp.]|nr:NADP-dependent oxidoreductase [Baekduia sp.]